MILDHVQGDLFELCRRVDARLVALEQQSLLPIQCLRDGRQRMLGGVTLRHKDQYVVRITDELQSVRQEGIVDRNERPFRQEMHGAEAGLANLARAQWNEVTRPEELARLVKAGLSQLRGKTP